MDHKEEGEKNLREDEHKEGTETKNAIMNVNLKTFFQSGT
jgi:hypothetical protein